MALIWSGNKDLPQHSQDAKSPTHWNSDFSLIQSNYYQKDYPKNIIANTDLINVIQYLSENLELENG